MADNERLLSGGANVNLRSYQQEVLEKSLERNVIVAMPTGSGKTHIAIARIQVELERSEVDRLVWFVAPNKSLSEQQYQVLRRNLPAYHVRSLTGADGVDKWTTKELWTAFLTGVHVVVGTPAVLADALTHSFVRLDRLSLCVFDEAHRCIKNDPMNRIMRDFYHPAKRKGHPTPHILALSASPVMQSDASKSGLEVVESNLDAMTVTPTRHQTELNAYVHPPRITKVDYSATTGPLLSGACAVLNYELAYYDFEQDPYILELQEQHDYNADQRLQKVRDTGKTDCREQLRFLYTRAEHLNEQLGDYFADWYICTCVCRYAKSGGNSTASILDLELREKRHIENILARVVDKVTNIITPPIQDDLSDKARALVDILSNNMQAGLRSIIFVEQRAMVLALAHLLRSLYFSNVYKIATYVGTSAGRTPSLVDLFDTRAQAQDLQDFRDGRKNLMITTNVLEEGIDVSACNCVVCFDPPTSLISFVQRRGRARQADSQYLIFVARGDLRTDPSRWHNLEEEMKKAYMDEQRAADTTSNEVDLEKEEMASRIKYAVESTGALLTLENARGHLNHFCAVATRHNSRYIDPQPDFATYHDYSTPKQWSASVNLPSFVHTSVRTANSSRLWHGEQAAIKDAAFNAYLALHQAGLVTDNLLPAIQSPRPDLGSQPDQPSLVQVAKQYSMWDVCVGSDTLTGTIWHASQLSFRDAEHEVSRVLWLPFPTVPVGKFQLHWSANRRYEASIHPMTSESLDADEHSKAVDWTSLVLRSVFPNSMPDDRGEIAFLLGQSDMIYINDFSGSWTGHEFVRRSALDLAHPGIVRVASQRGGAYMIQDVDNMMPRREFLHALDGNSATTSASEQSFNISECTVDRLKIHDSILAALLPSILHQIDITNVAHQLNATLLSSVGIKDTTKIIEAISAPAACEATGDYQRLEYLGDAILKFVTEFQVLAQHPTYPESYLSAEKDKIVRNSNLAKAALEAGLDRFVRTIQFTGKKWRPPLLSGMDVEGSREMSSKVLADVVEALIGAAYVDGGLAKACACIRTLLPKETWWEPDATINAVLDDATILGPVSLAPLERMIGHHFAHPSLLLEAVTHASQPNNRASLSYERLEFFGDAVLDLIITPKLHAHTRKLRHWDLHRIHEALVNGHFLGFCCMSMCGEDQIYDVVDTSTAHGSHMEVQPSKRIYRLYDFIRAGGQLLKAKQSSISRFNTLSAPITASLQSSDLYPWPDLTALAPEKFFSDIIEAILGALYLDTRGNLDICEVFMERLGILPTMRGILDRGVETAYPKERVGILADREEVQYVVQRTEREEAITWECGVVVGQREVARVGGCASREEAEVRAADCAAHQITVGMGEGRKTRRKLNVGVSV